MAYEAPSITELGKMEFTTLQQSGNASGNNAMGGNDKTADGTPGSDTSDDGSNPSNP